MLTMGSPEKDKEERESLEKGEEDKEEEEHLGRAEGENSKVSGTEENQ